MRVTPHGLAQSNLALAIQAGKLSDCMLHETAVAWVRAKLCITLPARPWEESPQQHLSRLKRIASLINAKHDAAGLRRDLPSRVEYLHQPNGGKLGR